MSPAFLLVVLLSKQAQVAWSIDGGCHLSNGPQIQGAEEVMSLLQVTQTVKAPPHFAAAVVPDNKLARVYRRCYADATTSDQQAIINAAIQEKEQAYKAAEGKEKRSLEATRNNFESNGMSVCAHPNIHLDMQPARDYHITQKPSPAELKAVCTRGEQLQKHTYLPKLQLFRSRSGGGQYWALQLDKGNGDALKIGREGPHVSLFYCGSEGPGKAGTLCKQCLNAINVCGQQAGAPANTMVGFTGYIRIRKTESVDEERIDCQSLPGASPAFA